MMVSVNSSCPADRGPPPTRAAAPCSSGRPGAGGTRGGEDDAGGGGGSSSSGRESGPHVEWTVWPSAFERAGRSAKRRRRTAVCEAVLPVYRVTPTRREAALTSR